jgi:hypothetical protein
MWYFCQFCIFFSGKLIANAHIHFVPYHIEVLFMNFLVDNNAVDGGCDIKLILW